MAVSRSKDPCLVTRLLFTFNSWMKMGPVSALQKEENLLLSSLAQEKLLKAGMKVCVICVLERSLNLLCLLMLIPILM